MNRECLYTIAVVVTALALPPLAARALEAPKPDVNPEDVIISRPGVLPAAPENNMQTGVGATAWASASQK